MWKTTLIAVSIVAVAGLSPAQNLIFSDDFEWGSICAWSNLWYVDSDGDGWGAIGTAGIPVSCPPPGGYAPNQSDCDEINPLINPGEDELCDFIDNDCDPTTTDGIGEVWFGDLCDGLDSDLCDEGAFECTDAVQVCSDESDDNIEICNTVDDDCNPVTSDGIGELWHGDPCDGLDTDLCEEGAFDCTGGVQVCTDESDDNIEICNTVDDDCNPATPDGAGEPWFGDPCDGLDADLCEEGTLECTDAVQACNDDSDDNIELCNTIDDDCNPVTSDGAGELWFGDPCDGLDTDLCEEGAFECTDSFQVCNDDSDDNIELCNTVDDDCNPVTSDGIGEAWFGDSCDGIDDDLCEEGVSICVGGFQSCDDETGDVPDICDGIDNDCDPTSADGSEDPLNGAGCDTGMPGICAPGTTQCTGGALTCEPNSSPTAEICDGLDNDCDGMPDEGNPGGGAFCQTGLPGVCSLGRTTCLSGAIQCIPDVEPSAEICDDFVDNDCDGAVDCDDESCFFDPACEK